MPTAPELRQQIIQQSETTALHQRIRESSAWRGGSHISEKSQGMDQELLATLPEIYEKHMFYLERKKQADPNTLSDYDLLALDLYPRLHNGELIGPEDMDALYMVLENLDNQILTDKSMATEMGLSDMDDLNEYRDSIGATQQEMFFRLQARDPHASFGPEKNRLIDQALNEKYGADWTGWRSHIRFLSKKERHRGRLLYAESTDSDEIMQSALEAHKDELFEAKESTYPPIAQLKAVALRESQAALVTYIKTDLSISNTIFTPAHEKLIADAGSPAALEQLLLNFSDPSIFPAFAGLFDLGGGKNRLIETELDAEGNRYASGGKYAEVDPRFKATELAKEAVLAEPMDRLAREVIKRNLPVEQAELGRMLAQERNELALLRAKSRRSRQENDRMAALEKKVPLMEQVINTTIGKGAMEVYKDPAVATFSALAGRLPGSMKDEYRDHLLGQLGLSGGTYANNTAKETAINGALARKDKFSITNMFMDFLGVKIRAIA